MMIENYCGWGKQDQAKELIMQVVGKLDHIEDAFQMESEQFNS